MVLPGDTYDDDALALRAVFIASVDSTVARPLVDGWRDELWLRSKMLERERETLLVPRNDGRPRSFPARVSLLARRLKHIGADLEFLDEFRRTYDGWLAERRAVPETSASHHVKPREGTGRSPGQRPRRR